MPPFDPMKPTVAPDAHVIVLSEDEFNEIHSKYKIIGKRLNSVDQVIKDIKSEYGDDKYKAFLKELEKRLIKPEILRSQERNSSGAVNEKNRHFVLDRLDKLARKTNPVGQAAAAGDVERPVVEEVGPGVFKEVSVPDEEDEEPQGARPQDSSNGDVDEDQDGDPQGKLFKGGSD